MFLENTNKIVQLTKEKQQSTNNGNNKVSVLVTVFVVKDWSKHTTYINQFNFQENHMRLVL